MLQSLPLSLWPAAELTLFHTACCRSDPFSCGLVHSLLFLLWLVTELTLFSVTYCRALSFISVSTQLLPYFTVVCSQNYKYVIPAPYCITFAFMDSFGEAVMTCDIPEPCKFPSLDSCRKRFLWTHTEVDLALHPAVGLMHK